MPTSEHMPASESIKALTRLLIGLAWKDGVVTDDEMEVIKDVTFRLPEIRPADWAELEIYWLMPIGETERNILIEEFVKTLTSVGAKAGVRRLLESLASEDNVINPEEQSLLLRIYKALDRNPSDAISDITRLLEMVVRQRHVALEKAERSVTIRAFNLMQEQFGKDMESRLGLDKPELEKLALTGALMAQVAYADRDISDTEIAIMEQILTRDWGLYDEHAKVMIDCAVDATRYQPDYYRLTRQFYEATGHEERATFLEVLFDIAHTHEGVSRIEEEEIWRITQALKLTNNDYKMAKNRKRRPLAA